MCFESFCKFLGMNPRTALKMAHGMCDLRRINPSAVAGPSLQRSVCSHFFMELYLCAAEQLPEVETETCGPDSQNELFQKSFRWSVETSVPERIAQLVSIDAESSVPLRFLPPGRLVDLWYQFLSWAESQRRFAPATDGSSTTGEIPSWATFYRCWKELFFTDVACSFERRANMLNAMSVSTSGGC